ncbi:hypothetical protein PHYBLDRAFT_68434 [Phycomyces blakesleeanus NRRL 1555(-)]|uniref:Uncharacterized protein n=1 Tax=Phycomyces blakesleeanus (strain ATCC 8743b / DSM 1359 / FGSC 10004 / NBRC 33097 / NRRL 1555) TaxID=763407 RepID=A0A162UUB2_PHYB8|nr:hypothetical protein PHYBLDRAFT_68434 [Phycomyces blakesleeanus NRRL 1555(-)]OAD78063.1 hypothetical protein PHYBLDRAFT_68434 [Phycomyces blakesleeanus NRRL 1555(-)]|eukprot:XP_018296103.1 hypothetical protein PHYBLDRAFT_68434 [Phycomyces blakesleeanus NRRL 1555(-)]
MKITEKCLILCLKNQLENMRNAHLSVTPLLLMSSQSVSAAISDLILKENTSTISHESTDSNNSTDLDDLMSNNDAKNLEFMQIINDFGISCQAHEKLAAHLNNILGMPTKITYRVCTAYLGKELLKHFPSVEETVYDVCQNGCMMFNDGEVACEYCGEACYKSNKTDKDGILIAEKTMVQIPLDSQIALSLANSDTHINQSNTFSLVKNDVAISLSVNGFVPHNIPSSITILYATVLNLPPMVGYEKSQMLQIVMIPGPFTPLNFWSFLQPNLADLKVLQEEGIVVITLTLTIRAKVYVLVVTGDILAVAKLACHADHMSKKSFQNFDQTSLFSKGLVGQSPFSSLASFTGLLFFILDKMHGLCHGIGKQVWELIGGKLSRFPSLHCLYTGGRACKRYNCQESIAWTCASLQLTHELGVISRGTNLYKKSMYLEYLYWNDKIEITVFTIDQHLLQYYPIMISAFGSPCAYSTKSVKCAIGAYSCAIKSNSAIGINAGNIIVRLAYTRQLLTDSDGSKQRGVILQYKDMSADWPITSKGECAGADSDIEFWKPLEYETIDNSFENISCLPILI